MIYVDRDRKDREDQPIRPNDAWFVSADKARAAVEEEAAGLLADRERGQQLAEKLAFEADRGVYAHKQVTIALKELFYEKCAYCEGALSGQGPWDVEHYRPKGRVHNAPEHPGYYWKTYDWDNLYPSCQRCNRRFRDPPTWAEPTYGPAAGKLDQFPLVAEAARAMNHLEDLEREEPLILDPCLDRPQEYLTFGRNGWAISVDENPKGKATISILHLNRKDLRELRKNRIQEVLAVIEYVRARNPRPEEALKELAEIYFKPSSRYSAACQAIWRNPRAFGLGDLDLGEF